MIPGPPVGNNRAMGSTCLPGCAMRCTQLIPVLFVIIIVMYLFNVFIQMHLIPKLEAPERIVELVLFSILFLIDVIAYIRAAMTHPGVIPNEKEWLQQDGEDESEGSSMQEHINETKRSGQRRYCKWCEKYKPDRCHHCRVCRQCILKMDHHCPWIGNCVGFKNHKYFLLVIFYSAILSLWVSASMFAQTVESTKYDTPYWRMCMLLSAETLAIFLSIGLLIFCNFHIWLFLNGLTTIEFCEKSLRKSFNSQYSQGCIQDIYNNLGPRWYLWLLPLSPPDGEGLYYESIHDRKPLNPRLKKKYGSTDDAIC